MPNTKSLDLELSSSQYASITDGAQSGLDIVGDITVEFWVKPETIANGVVASKANYGNNNRSWYIVTRSTGVEFLYSSDGTSANQNAFRTDAVELVVGTWSHVAITADVSAKTVIFYIDGVAVASSTITDNGATSIFNSATNFAIGAMNIDATPAEFFDGLVDEVRVWNDIRTATEIKDNYQKELVGDEAGLVGYWQLNDDYLDQTSNDNDLTASGSPVFSSSTPPWPPVASKRMVIMN